MIFIDMDGWWMDEVERSYCKLGLFHAKVDF